MGRGIKVFLAVLLIAMVVGGVAIYYIATNVVEPQVDIKRIRLKNIDAASRIITFKVSLEVDNQNSFSATLRHVDVQVYFNGRYVGHVDQDMDITIASKKTTMVDTDFVMEKAPIITENNVRVRIVGTITVKVATTDFPVDVDHTDVVQVI